MLIDSITPILDLWKTAEEVYRDFNNIPAEQELTSDDWTLIEATVRQLQMTEGE